MRGRIMLATQNRVVFLDYLRVVACFMVMAIHSAEPFYLGGEAPNITAIASRWDMFWITLTECLCRVAVPLFVMASSYLLFPVRRPTGEFFRRRFVRVAVPFVVWAAAYIAGEGNGNPLHCSCLENPRDGEPGGLPSLGSHRVGHD